MTGQTSQNQHRFGIGIGSQRAGSTLLHNLLDESTSIFMHPLKELHYFDSLFHVRAPQALVAFSRRQLDRQLDEIIAATQYGFIDKSYKCLLRTNKILASTPVENVDYLNLFRPCLMGNPVVGESTPEYMLFSVEQLRKMKVIVGEDASFILVCRNPVRRLLSAAKLVSDYHGLNMTNDQMNEWLAKTIAAETGWMTAQDRYNDYRGAMERYTSVFRRVVAVSYDDLVTEPKMAAAKIAGVIGVDIDEEAFQGGVAKVHNALSSKFEFDPKLVENLTERYRAEQSFIESEFSRSVRL